MTLAGLTASEVAQRQARLGPNVLPAAKIRSPVRQLVDQMTHFFARLLWIAGGFAFLAGMPQLGVAIFVVVLVNGAFAFAQEFRAERAAERLRDLLPRRASVRRDGVVDDIDATGLVPDDVVLLNAGDRISADLELAEGHGLRVDTSLLTGESRPRTLHDGDSLFAGTFVVEGEGEAVVRAIGGATRLAGIAALTHTATRPASPLARELDRVVRVVAAIAVGVGVAFFALALLLGTPATDGFLFAIGVTVALVPEGLLPTVTLSLAIGAQRMAGRRALVRRLESVETLGSTTFVCTDKTGTLTENRMAVVAVWTPQGVVAVHGHGYEPDAELDGTPEAIAAASRLAAAAARCSSGRAVLRNGEWIAQGDPMEAALDALGARTGFDREHAEAEAPEHLRIPFDPKRRRMSVVVGTELIVKGAPDAVFPRAIVDDTAKQALSDLAGRGLRVLAVARRTVDPDRLRRQTGNAQGAVDGDSSVSDPSGAIAETGEATRRTPTLDPDRLERDLELLGLVALEDPPRASAADAVAACRRAGVAVAMVTGDHPATALAIAREVGIVEPGDERPRVVVGRDLPADDQLLAALVDFDGLVVARVEPEQKLRIARALRSRGHVVAMTGDGVNDGPALHEADIGVAMGRSGTDVAREAADLVLLDDDFATMVAAIEHGRATFANIRRFLTYHLTDNVAELTPFVVWALSGGRFPLAIGVLQVLMLDIGTDLLPALALGAEPPAPGMLERPPRRGHLIDRAILRRVFGVLGPTEALVEMTAFGVGLAAAGWRPGDAFPTGHALLAASGAAFSAVVIGQAANAFACRSEHRPVTRLRWGANPLLIAAVGVELALLLVMLLFEPFARLLKHAAPPAAGLAVAIAAFPAVLIADTLAKRWVARHRESRPADVSPERSIA